MRKARFGVVLAVVALAWAAAGLAEDRAGLRFHRIVTGTASGTYFPVGSLIANAVSNPPGSRPCEQGGTCGVPGLIAVAVTSEGSLANLESLRIGAAESALVQSDVAYWAFSARERYAKAGALPGLRAIANLYPETLQVVVRRDAGIATVRELKGRRVSLGPKESGTYVEARLLLALFGLKPSAMRAVHLSPAAASDAMRAGELDAFVVVAGFPVPALSALAEALPVDILPVDGSEADALIRNNPFFAPTVVPGETYADVPARITLSVGALWVTTEAQDDELVYQLTRALWHPNNRRLFEQGHTRARLIRRDTALDGLAIPLHEGARRYYREVGVLQDDTGG